MTVRNSTARARGAATASDDHPKRCAIYTRKSTSEGLEQAFNSLDAQRDACLEYIRRQPGWVELATRYDDGGFTGANIERPGFQQLLADIEARRIDIVVCYKVDRLSRSLIDFARVMEQFDAHGVSFVSVTQNFSTATAMGRFTLHILMSFAEFEREMIRERTRDKLAAAKRAGHWIGGTLPLGYNAVGGKLAINVEEALIVVKIFKLYAQLTSAMEVARALNTWREPTKRERMVKGRARKPTPWSAADVYRILKNPLYIGQISVDNEVRAGSHPAIIEPAVFEATQELLRAGRAPRQAPVHNPAYLLSGVLFCSGCGGRCTTASSRKNGIIRRYYRCSTRLKRGPSACTGRMIPAVAIEAFVTDRLREVLATGVLAEHLTAALPERLAAERRTLELERASLPAKIADLSASVQRNLESLDRVTGPARRPIEARLQDASDARERAEARQREVDRQLHRLASAEADALWLTDCLAHFDRLWGVLTPANQARLVRAIIEQVEIDENTSLARIRFVDAGDLLETSWSSAPGVAAGAAHAGAGAEAAS